MLGQRSFGAAAAYLGLLAASHAWVAWRPVQPQRRPAQVATVVSPVDEQPLRVAYEDSGGSGPVVLAVHGSPGDSGAFRALTRRLAPGVRVIAPDLPGFGASSAPELDYSIRAQAERLRAFADALRLERYHVVGHSLGGGVALYLADADRSRVASLTLVSSIGVQETELTGDYEVNHALHAVQLATLRAAREALPHFGVLDRQPFNLAYARSFYDTDQRPLRGILSRIEAPLLIVHGREDALVPVETALESKRLAPYAELLLLDDDHFFLFTRPEEFAPVLTHFVERSERGAAERREAFTGIEAARDLHGRAIPLRGVALWAALALLFAATFASEDLSCIAAGLLIAHGRVGFVSGVAACYLGIVASDAALYVVGRSLGRSSRLRRGFLTRIGPAELDGAASWLQRRRVAAIALSRFTPGLRLPTYVAAGALGISPLGFAVPLVVAAAAWTPLAVGAGALVGTAALRMSPAVWAAWGVAVAVAFAATRRPKADRRLWVFQRRLVGRLRRLTRWEFWPAWAAYLPLLPYLAWLGAKGRSLTLFTAANPAFDGAGGLVGESKSRILRLLERAGAPVAPFIVVPAGADAAARLAEAEAFVERCGKGYPVVVKPDVGERGSGVAIVRSREELRHRLDGDASDLIVQEYVAGEEFGVFYYRLPPEARGALLSITAKTFPEVVGDGRRTFEELILADDRAVCLVDAYLRQARIARDAVLPAGAVQPLIEVGSHCRGAVFLDATDRATPALLDRLDAFAERAPGFAFGRYDLRAASLDSLARGEEFQILELNGVSAESANVYDPRMPLVAAYRLLFRQWRLAFEIGARHRALGFPPATLAGVVRLALRRREPRPSARPDPQAA